jgi:hypothetical protein
MAGRKRFGGTAAVLGPIGPQAGHSGARRPPNISCTPPQAFFAAAPPDDPEPAAEPMRFDDDTTPTPARVRPRTRYLQTLSVVRSAAARLFAAIDGRRLETQVMAAALAATVLVTALSPRALARGWRRRLQRCVFVAE